jgi:UDP-N-acetylmuramoyl-L-alanyl-D-glutamate--2,6-diaminopimelate ligase
MAAGAVAVVVEDESSVPGGVTSVKVSDSRLAMSLMAAEFYRQPTAGLPLIGITGTNGKTTTTYLLESILEQGGIPPAVLGTVNYRFGTREFTAPHTTPESIDLQRMLRQLADLGAKGVVMEVSSHALEQRRVDGCHFDVGVFTNLTRDHLDYHGDMESYLASKQRLFSELLVPDDTKGRRRAVVNIDDSYGERIANVAACPVITYGLAHGAEVTARNVNFSVNGIQAELVTPLGEIELRSALLGRFNLSNILAAVAAAVAMELPLAVIAYGIKLHKTVPGRLERVPNNCGVTLLVDYAHTGDALENVLRTIQELATARIITIFGCGGDRDRGKRPIMGEIAGRMSDLAIITSDNPRSEEPLFIITEIREGLIPLGGREYRQDELNSGFGGKGFVAIESRREAIRLAVKLAQPGDIVLLAGKGHEDYQIIGSRRDHFDDREEAAAAFREREGGGT